MKTAIETQIIPLTLPLINISAPHIVIIIGNVIRFELAIR
jgi:hypothetical protein